jgi:hypothetical protein
MSYIVHDFDIGGAEPLDRPATPALAGLFSRLELTVIALARNEPARSARAPSRLRRLIGRLFEIPPANLLADNRLECLRRTVIVARRRGEATAQALLPDLARVGFSRLQTAAILAEAKRP